jgi:hypothetical protein
MNDEKLAILILELGQLEVFHYQTLSEYSKKIMPTQVYWKLKMNPIIHGPFPDTYRAVGNYTAHLEELKANTAYDNVININFKTKKKV